MLFYIVRHGETRSNVEGRLQGWIDDPLNENGTALAKVTGRGLQGVRFGRCITSPLRRAYQTAQTVLEESGNVSVPIETEDRIREIHMGEWEGRRISPRFGEVDQEMMRLFFTDPFRFPGFPGGEKVTDVCQRTQAFLRELAREGKEEETCLLVTHGVALRSMLNFLYDDPADFWHGHVPYNCAVNIVSFRDGQWRLLADDRLYYEREAAVDRYAAFR